MNFQKFYFDEKEMYINLDDKPGNQNLGKVDTDDEHYNKKINRIRAQLNLEEIKECLGILMKDKNLQAYETEFTAIFVKYTMNQKNLKRFAEAVKGNNSFDYSKDFTIKQMYEHYNKVAPNAVHPKFYTALYGLIPGGGQGGQIGKGELLLALLTKLDKATRGDLKDTDGSIIELKLNRARFKGGESRESIFGPAALQKIAKITNKEMKSKGVNNAVMQLCFDHMKNNPKDIEEVLKIMINYTSQIEHLPKEAVSIMKRDINKPDGFKTFLSLSLALQAYAYTKVEGINKIFFLKGATVEDATVMILSSTDNFVNLFNFIDNKLKFADDWSSQKASFVFEIK